MAEAGSRIGVVTVTYNSARFLDEFVASCRAQTYRDHHIYCIDNASHDATPDALSALDDPSFSVTLNRDNVGIAAGNNQGVVRALADGCDWILLLNNDTTFGPSLFAQLLAACRQRGWRAVVPKILYDQPAGHIWYGGGGFNPRRGHTGFHVGIGAADHGQFDAPGTVAYSPTCCMLVHRSVFEEVGLMDESYFVYFDDTDFCWRLGRHRIPIGYWPAATLVHKVGGSTGGVNSPFTARITARNRLYFLKKHFGPLSPWLWLAVFLPYYGARYLLGSWNPACFKASLEGSLAFASMTPRVPALSTTGRADGRRAPVEPHPPS